MKRKVINKKIILTLVLCITLCIYAIFDIEIADSNYKNVSYSIITSHFGLGSKAIEQEITIPMENTISKIQGIKNISSYSELGKSRINILLHKSTNTNEFYLALRDKVDDVYSVLPRSVQKPQIIATNSDSEIDTNSPCFIISFYSDQINNDELGNIIETTIKKEYSLINGVAEIKIGGSSQKEIQLKLDNNESTMYSITPNYLSIFLQANIIQKPIGKLENNFLKTPVNIFAKPDEIKELNDFFYLTNSCIIPLSNFTKIDYGYREKESISRVNNIERIIVYITASGGENIISLCKKLYTHSQKYNKYGFETEIIYNMGEELQKPISRVLFSLISGMIIVMFFIVIYTKSIRDSIVLSLLLPLSTLFCLTILIISNKIIDHYILSGIAFGLGIIIDNGIVVSDFFNNHSFNSTQNNSIKKIIIPVTASTITTCIVLIPLIFINSPISGIAPICIALLVLLIVSFFVSIIFLPPFSSSKKSSHKIIETIFEKLSLYAINKSKSTLLFSAITLFAAIICLFFIPISTYTRDSNDSIFAQLEFESGANKKYVDKETQKFVSLLLECPYVEIIETNANTGCSKISIKHKKNSQKQLLTYIDSIKNTTNGYLHIPSSYSKSQSYEINITGPDLDQLKILSKVAMNNFTKMSSFTNGVYHYKEDPPSIVFYIDSNKASFMDINTKALIQNMRYNINGEVILKWQENLDEIDFRIMNPQKNTISKTDIENFFIPKNNKDFIQIKNIGKLVLETEPGKILRMNRQHCISFSITTNEKDINKNIKNIQNVLSNIDIPKGYAFNIDKSLVENKKNIFQLLIAFILAFFLVYAILVIIFESFFYPLLVMLSIPFSFTIPILSFVILNKSFSEATITGFVILCGIAVNNPVIIISDLIKKLKQNNYNDSVMFQVIKNRASPIFMTTATTVAGAIPLLLSGIKSSNLESDFAQILLTGVIGSVLYSVLVLPVIMSKVQLLKRKM